MTAKIPTLRGRRSVAVALVSGLAGAIIITAPADARHSIVRHSASSESSSPPYAAIVVDANTGSVLHATNPDELRHPASLTKIMTLYLLFERLEAGKLKLDSPLSVSEHAAAQAPTKVGLRPGETIEVEDAIRALVTKSANDCAVVIAEAIGGDEHDFADMMTRKAHALGMSRTLYRNASGLPNDEQVTTARDQATLGRAIQERFPRYYRYFATPSFTYRGMVMRNHNHLLGQVEGLDGIKTGYTQASGFNLVTSVRRNNRHIVSVVLGGASAGARDARMRSLIEQYIVVASTQHTATAIAEAPSARDAGKEARFAEARPANRGEAQGVYAVASVLSRPVSLPATTPAANPVTVPAADTTATPAAATRQSPANTSAPAGPVAAAAPAAIDEPIKPIHVKTVKVKLASAQAGKLMPVLDTSAKDDIQAIDTLAAARASAPSAAVQAAAAPEPLPPPPPQKPGILGVLSARDAAKASEPRREAAPAIVTASAAPVNTTQSIAAAPTPSAPAHGITHSGWIIQIGAFDVERDARQKLSAVQAKAAALGHADAFTEAVVKGDKTLYRARFAGLQKEEAEAVCRQLKRNDIACMTIKN